MKLRPDSLLSVLLTASMLMLGGCLGTSTPLGSSDDSSAKSSLSKVTATAGSSFVSLSWTSIINDTEAYNVKRSISEGGGYTTVAFQLTNRSFVDQSVENGITYYYIVTAFTDKENLDTFPIKATPQIPKVTFLNTDRQALITAANQYSFRLHGTCNLPNLPIKLTGLVSDTVLCSSSGTWSKTYNFSKLFDSSIGYSVNAEFADTVSNEVSHASVILQKNTNVPIVTITSPADRSFIPSTSYSALTISGSCSENGVPVMITATDGTSSVAASPIPLCNKSSSPNWVTFINLGSLGSTITLKASQTDWSGNEGVSLPATLFKPIEINSPSNGAFINQVNKANTVVKGICSNGLTVKLNVDGQNVSGTGGTVCTNSSFSTSLNASGFSDGQHTLTANVVDSNGTTWTSSSINFFLDTQPPTLAFSSPTSLSVINIANRANFTVTGNCSENGKPVTVQAKNGTTSQTISNINCNTSAASSFAAVLDLTSLNDGTITFTASQTDPAGNSNTGSTHADKRTIAPRIAFTYPTSSTIISNVNDSSSFSVAGTCNLVGVPITIKIDGVILGSGTCNGSTFTGLAFTLNLLDGFHSFTAHFVDSFNNSGESSPVLLNKAASVNGLTITGMSSAPVAGIPQSVIINAVDSSGYVARFYRGTIAFTVSDPKGSYPVNYTFTAEDSGSHSFPAGLLFKTAGPHNITVRDVSNADLSGYRSVTVIAGVPAAESSTITASPSTGIFANGMSVSTLNIQFKDAYGNPAPGITPSLVSTGLGNTMVVTGASNSSGRATATLKSTFGQTKTVSITVPGGITATAYVIFAPMSLNISSPLDNSFISLAGNSTQFSVSGTCGLNSYPVILKVDGSTVSSANCSNSTFSGTINSDLLTPTTHTLIAVSTDTQNNSFTSAAITFTKDITPPNVAFATPSVLNNVNQSNESSFLTSGSCSENGRAVEISVTDGSLTILATPSPVCTSQNFSTHLNLTSLANGNVTFKATQSDAAGNTTTSSAVTVTKKSFGPTIAVTSPVANSYINISKNSANYTVAGTCSEMNQPVTIHVNGSPAIQQVSSNCDNTNKFSLTMSTLGLADSLLAVSAVITDYAGNSTTSSPIGVTKDTVPPTLAFVNLPSYVNIASQNAFSLTGICSEGGRPVTLRASDGIKTVGPVSPNCNSGLFSGTINLSTLSDKAITFTANLSDSASNSISISNSSIVKDTRLPTLSITSPSSTFLIHNDNNSSTFSVAGECSEASQNVEIKVDNIVFSTTPCNGTSYAGSFSTLSLSDGSHTLKTTITSVAGNPKNSASIAFTKSTAATTLAVNGVPASVVAGVSHSVTVTAKDSSGFTVQDYSGTVTFASTDSRVIIPHSYTFFPGEKGVHVFTEEVTFKTAGLRSISASDTSSGTITGAQSNIQVTPATISSTTSKVTANPSTQVLADAITSSNITVIAQDAFGNAISNITPSSFTVSGTKNVFTTPGATNSNGQAFASLKSSFAETKTISVTLPGAGTLTTPVSFIWPAADPSSSTVTSSVSAVPADGINFATIKVTLRTSLGILLPGKLVSLASNRSTLDMIAPASAISDANGEANFTVRSTATGTAILTATNITDGNFEIPQTVELTLDPGPPTQLLLTGLPNLQTAGNPNTFTVTVRDASNNIATGFNGTITFSANDTQISYNPGSTYQFVPATDGGTHIFTDGITLATAGSRSITVSSGVLASGVKSGIIIVPAAASSTRSTITATPNANLFANGMSTSSITVTLKDAYNNAVSGVTPFLLASGLGNTLAGSTATNTSGVMSTATIKSTVAEPKTISITSPSGLTNTATVTFSATTGGAALSITNPNMTPYTFYNNSNHSNFTVSGNCNINNGSNQNVFIQVDGSNASGTGGTLGAVCTGVTFATTIDVRGLSEGSHIATAVMNDVVGNTITSSAVVLTKAINATQLVMSGLPASLVAGTPQNITVTAQDAGSNVATNFRGTVTFGANDTQASFSPVSYAFLAGDNGSRVFSNSVTLKSAGNRTVTVSTANAISTSQSANVLPFNPSTLAISNLPNSQFAGTSSNITVTAQDIYSNTATGFNGTITFTTSDTNFTLSPTTYTFVPATDQGTRTFTNGVTLRTAGSQSITVRASAMTSGVANNYLILPSSPSSTNSSLSANPTSNLFSNGLSTSSISITLKDIYGNSISGFTPVLASSGTGNIFSGTGTTNSSGSLNSWTLKSTVGGAKIISFTSPSGLTNTTSVTFMAVTGAGSLAITSPLNSINQSTNSSTFTATGTCNISGQAVSIRVDGSAAAGVNNAVCTGAAFSTTINTTALSEAVHTFVAVMSDTQGNAITSPQNLVTKDLTSPTVTLDSPADLSVINISNNSSVFSFSGTCSENSRNVTIQMNGSAAPGQTGGTCTAGIYSAGVNTTGLTDGAYTFTAVLADAAGNTITSTTSPTTRPWANRLVTIDRNNSRAMIWNSFPTSRQQPMDLVLGQPDMTSAVENNGGISASALRRPHGIGTNGTVLTIADSLNNRVLIWNSMPTMNGQAANLVLGQPNMTTSTANTGGLSASSLSFPQRATIFGNRLLVSDTNNARVLVWNSIPTANKQNADLVLGQPNMTSGTSNNGGISASSLGNGSTEAWTDGTRLLIADATNSRVLMWNTFPSSNGRAADLVLGQPNMTTGTANTGGISASSMKAPASVMITGNKLIVADNGNARVLIWNSIPTSNGEAADVVVGQPDFTSNTNDNGGMSARTLAVATANGVASDGQRLIVSEANARLLVWNSIPTSNFEPADIVLGQPDFTSLQFNNGGTPTPQGMAWVYGVATWTVGASPSGVVLTKDTSAPSVSIASPTGSSTINPLNQTSFTAIGSCSENGSTVVVSATTGTSSAHPAIQPLCTSSSWSTTLNLSALPDGTITFRAVQTDSAYNSTTSATVSVAKNSIATAAQSTIAIAPTTLVLDGSSQSTITVTVKSSSGSALMSKSVTLTSSRGASDVITTSPTTTNGSGIATFTVRPTVIGSATFTAAVDSITLTTSANFTAQAANLVVSGYPTPQMTGTPGSITVTAQTGGGATVTNYVGTVTFTSSDTAATLPSTYTFTVSDAGTRTFSNVSLRTRGIQSISATDNGNILIGTQSGINVISTLTANFPFASQTESQYTFDSSKIQFSAGGVAQLKTIPQTDSDNSSTGFGGGTLNGVLYDSTNNYIKLDPTIATNTSELDSTWTPAYSNLIHYYKLNGTVGSITNGATVTATVGTSATAYSSNGTGMAYTATGKLNTAITFDGVDDHLKVVPSGSVTGSYSVSMWVYLPTVPPSVNLALFSTNSPSDFGSEFLITTASGLHFGAGNGTSWVSSGDYSYPFVANQYYHITATYSPTEFRAYVNGELAGSTVYTSFSPILYDANHQLFIGQRGTNTNYFKGLMDEVAIWNSTLTANQIKTIYDRQSAKFSGSFTSRVMDVGPGAANAATWSNLTWSPTLPFGKGLPSNAASETTTTYSNLVNSTLMSGNVGLWHLDEISGTTLSDSSGNNNTGTKAANATLNSPGKLNGAVKFDGSSTAFISVPDSASLRLTGDMTVFAWVRPQASGTHFGILSKTGSTAKSIPAPYDFYVHSTGRPNLVMGNGSVYQDMISTNALPVGMWSFVAVTRSGNTVTHYLNGVANGSHTVTTTVGDQAQPLRMGGRADDGVRANGMLDEVGIYNRSLSATELRQIFQRGASRLKFQVRSCASNPCNDTTETYKGPDGTHQTYFSEAYNTSNNLTTGSILNSLPNMVFSAFSGSGLSVAANRYFQYRAILETDYETDTTLGPHLKSTTIGPVHYDTSIPTISNSSAVPFYKLSGITETLGAGSCSGGIRYQISRDKSNWYYLSGSTWTLSNSNTDYAQSSSNSNIQSNITTFDSQIGNGNLYFRAFLPSNGNNACELDNLSFTGTQFVDSGASTSGLVASFNAAYATGSKPQTNGCASSSLKWTDLSPRNFTASLTGFNTPTCNGTTSGWTGTGTAASPYALAFNGSTDYAELTSIPATVDFSQGFSIEAWVNYATSSHWSRIIDFGNGANSDNILIGRYITTSRIGIGVYRGGSGTTMSSSTGAIENNTWQHVVVTLVPSSVGASTGTAVIYVNGTSVGNQENMNVPMNVARNANYIGKSNYGDASDPLFQGKMGAIRVYNRGLTGAEVQQSYQAGTGIYY